MTLPSKTAQKLKAQELLMHGIAKVLGYWAEDGNPFSGSSQDGDGNWMMGESLTEAEEVEFKAMLQREADRIAKLMGYQEAWSA